MKVSYSLKVSQPTNFVEPLVKHIQENYDLQTSYGFKPLLGKICQLRNKATTVNLTNDASAEELDNAAELISAYTKYALIFLKRFNWDVNRGRSVQGVQITWSDSFQPTMQFSKNTILFDIFCCYYNLAVIYFTRAMQLSQVDLAASRKQAMTKARYAAYLLGEMKDKYYGQFIQVGFHDTQFPHLDMLQNICMGLIYKCLFHSFRESEYKMGINKIASISGMAAKYYLKAYNVGSAFFANQSGISDKTKTELLSLSYIESLYFDTITNIKYAKYYNNLLQKDQSYISIVIAYEKKAQRLIDIGLKDHNVEQLFNMNIKQKKQLIQMQKQLYQSLSKNVERNAQLFKQPEIKEEQIPPQESIPKEWIAKIIPPPNLSMTNEGEFSKLMSDQSYLLALQLSTFSANRKAAIESSQKKLDEEIQKAFNDSYVNFLMQIQGEEVQKNLPKALQEKLFEIRKRGGKIKIEQQIKILKDNQSNNALNLKNIRQTLRDEETIDNQKRSKYGDLWSRPPSQQINAEYNKNIDKLDDKLKIALGVDLRIMDKYERNKQIIETLDANDETIVATLPKPNSTNFVQANAVQLAALKQKTENLKKHRDSFRMLGLEILQSLQKINYPKVANSSLAENRSKEQIFKAIFEPAEGLINQFNAECKKIKDEVAIISSISLSLNAKNKQQDNSKRDFEKVIKSYNEVSQLFNEMVQSGGFYTKLNDIISKLTSGIEEFVYARKISTQDMQKNIKNNKGGSSFHPPKFPSMGPEQNINTTLPVYNGPLPGSCFMGSQPPTQFSFNNNEQLVQQPIDPQSGNMNDVFRMMGDSLNNFNPFDDSNNNNKSSISNNNNNNISIGNNNSKMI